MTPRSDTACATPIIEAWQKSKYKSLLFLYFSAAFAVLKRNQSKSPSQDILKRALSTSWCAVNAAPFCFAGIFLSVREISVENFAR